MDASLLHNCMVQTLIDVDTFIWASPSYLLSLYNDFIMIVYILQTINEAVVYEPIKCIRTLTRNRFYLPPYAMEENITRLDIHLYAVKIYSTDIYRVRKIFTKIF